MRSHEARLRALELECDPVAALLAKGGLSNVLAAGVLLPRRDCDDDDLDEDTTGMGRLLAEARQWHKERGHGQ